jgi:predicted esterase
MPSPFYKIHLLRRWLFNKKHAPLLITAGSIDNIIPAHLNHRNFKAYKTNGSVLDYKEFAGRNHNALGQPGWEADADYVLNWISKY